MKNWIIGILVMMIAAMMAYYFIVLQDKSASNFNNKTKDKNVISTEMTTITLADNISLSEKQLVRMKVYQMLTEDAVLNMEKKDTMPIDCGTRLTQTQYDEINDFSEAACTPEKLPNDTVKNIEYPLYIHIVKTSEQQNLINTAAITQAISILNNKFATAKIRFAIKGTQNIISNRFTNFNENDQPFLLNQYKRNGFINIFIFSSVAASNGQALNGYTTFGRGDDFIMMTAGALQNGTTLAHETGHYFLLYHTHGKTNSGATDELVDGSSCSCTGDDVCDTPADPNLFGIVGNTCVYTGNATDINGVNYKPDPKNLMSYAHLCRYYFTKGQYNRVRWAALSFRNYFL